MDSNNEFDKLIREKLANGEQNVPSNLKGLIEHSLVKKGLIKKDNPGRKLFYVAFSVFTGLIFICGGIFYFENNFKASFYKQPVKNSAVSTKFENMISRSDNKVSNVESSIISSESKRSSDERKLREADKIKNTETPKYSREVQAKNNKITLKNTDRNKFSAPVKSIDNSKTTMESLTYRRSGNKSKASNNISLTTKHVNTKSGIEPPNVSNASLVQEPEKQNSLNSNLVIEQNPLTKLNEDQNTITPDSTQVINSTVSIATLNTNENVVKSTSNSNDTVPLKNDSTRINKYSIESYGGIQWTIKQNSKSGSGTQNTNKNNKNSEIACGVKLNVFFKNITIGTGINYSNHNSEMSTIYTTSVVDTMLGLIQISFPAHIKSNFDIVDLPLLIGYNFNLKKLAIHIESGVSLSFISCMKSTLTIDSTGVVVNNFTQVATVKNYYNYVAQISLLYSLSNRLQFFMQPSLNLGLSGIFKEMPGEKISVFSARTGLRLKF